MTRRRRGFTYLELMIVAAIIGILAAIGIANFLEARTRSEVSRSKSDLATFKMALDAYRLETRAYPPNAVAGRPDGWDLRVLTTPISYQPTIPRDFFAPGRPFAYYNALQVDPAHGLQIAGADCRYFNGFAAGLLWGMGPADAARNDQDHAKRKIRDFTKIEDIVIEPGGRARLAAYDPTNGTLSPGNIFVTFP
jgi:prepilin-type N-terminal cleavage/methylation domain-containing protein